MMNLQRPLIIAALFLIIAACAKTGIKDVEKADVNQTPTENADTVTFTNEEADVPVFSKEYLEEFCMRELVDFPGPYERKKLKDVCQKIEVTPGCQSVNGDPIFHYDKMGRKEDAKRILVMSMIHGDEIPAGSVSRAWMTRLERISPRNSWRVIPIANPDGVKLRTRMNAAGVDLNRNFPSADWDKAALFRWKTKKRSDKRRYPGPGPASEPETKCLMKAMDDFKPDFVISVHTPLGVLDFDGPKIKSPNFGPLPWTSLGNFPGSLGRYMWVDRNVPVLTIELKGADGLRRLAEFDLLQDITGTIAIQADKMNKKRKKK